MGEKLLVGSADHGWSLARAELEVREQLSFTFAWRKHILCSERRWRVRS